MEYLFFLCSISMLLLVISVKYIQLSKEIEALKNQITAYQLTIENMEAAQQMPEEWLKIVSDLADELEGEVKTKYTPETLIYQSQKRNFDVDMDSVIRARSMLSASKGKS